MNVNALFSAMSLSLFLFTSAMLCMASGSELDCVERIVVQEFTYQPALNGDWMASPEPDEAGNTYFIKPNSTRTEENVYFEGGDLYLYHMVDWRDWNMGGFLDSVSVEAYCPGASDPELTDCLNTWVV